MLASRPATQDEPSLYNFEEVVRSIYCGQVNEAHAGQTITPVRLGPSSSRFNGLIFIDMRDREGIVQVFFDPDKPGRLCPGLRSCAASSASR